MRKLEYLSPTSISKYLSDPQEFYITYLSDVRVGRFPQTRPMSIGSSFDAYIKSFLHERLVGKDPKFEFETLFEKQVESQNRDWAREHGKYAFDYYQKAGALADIMLELQQSIASPRFEFDVLGTVQHREKNYTVPLLGKPDVYFVNGEGCSVTLDFKVNGWLSPRTVSPKPGYLKIRTHNSLLGPHKECVPIMHRGMMINGSQYLDDIDEEWARQLTIYSLLCGADLGDGYIVAIDQFACKPAGVFPDIRIAQHRLRIRPEFQLSVMDTAQSIWDAINSDHIFRDLSKQESADLCAMLDCRAKSLSDNSDPIFNSMVR